MVMETKRSSRSGTHRRAMMLVEAAIVLPMLLGVTFLLLQYGWLFLKAEQVANAARYGARLAIVADATPGAVQTSVQNYLADLSIAGPTVTVGDVDVAKGELVNVTVSVQVRGNPQMDLLGFSELAGFQLPILPATLRSSVSMAKERS